MITRRGRLAVVALAALALTSCTKDKQEVVPTTTTEAPPAPTTTTTSEPSAPPVAHPLDAVDFVDNPCASLTEEQRRQYGVIDVERTTLAAREGESCFFHREPSSNYFWIGFASKISSGLTYQYIEHAQGQWEYWQPTELDGYPAVAYGNNDPSACFFAVGVSDSLHFWVTTSTDDPTCTESRTIASTVLANVKAAN